MDGTKYVLIKIPVNNDVLKQAGEKIFLLVGSNSIVSSTSLTDVYLFLLLFENILVNVVTTVNYYRERICFITITVDWVSNYR